MEIDEDPDQNLVPQSHCVSAHAFLNSEFTNLRKNTQPH